MDQALHGFLLGLGIGFLLLVSEYVLLTKAVSERAKKLNRKAEFDVTERQRVLTMLRFAALLPFVFALVFWWIWA